MLMFQNLNQLNMKWREKKKKEKEKEKVILNINRIIYFKEQEINIKKAKNKIDSE